ncbi:N-acetylglucosamine-6-phosphate deacetylase [Picrophilus oshimae]|uniref:N-acetylglucosamine 6-phosphate deacetylase n=1 Tax=Picrophilus torridus (strain ATCC 700027 / DSM 9790 / JCM 10055 / NBRC 100828 / KAW 2/3) TaxID=1122961 RepID=A0A8G2FXM9_PICTO|nr:N-acetylglucosamine-6-phosphate deacetylase [Picrophilus oshimae]SMD31401.1 N-acetylglucosamine 6-phosphate deacetylase [Picrophilus oshimae DSM 9789]
MNYSLLAGIIPTPDGIYNDYYINISGSMIKSITRHPDYLLKDRLNAYIAMPGFIDIHTHGYYGIDAMESSYSDIHKWASMLAMHGVTSFIPACVSSPVDDIIKFIKKIGYAMSSQDVNEARIIGARSEGPYINVKKRGAHNPDFIRKIDKNEILSILNASNNTLKIIDIAPELDNFQEALSMFNSSGTIVSIGHSNADFNRASMAINSGAMLMTHFYNAMTAFNHRAPGMIDAGLLSDVFLEVIPDMHHVSWESINIMLKIRGPKRIIAITDSLSIGGTDKYSGTLGGLGIDIKDGVAWISGTETIAGSVLTMERAFKNLYEHGINIDELAEMLSGNAARLLGMENYGMIWPGMIADINIVNENIDIVNTIINGNPLK